jgi:hypothetical protein
VGGGWGDGSAVPVPAHGWGHRAGTGSGVETAVRVPDRGVGPPCGCRIPGGDRRAGAGSRVGTAMRVPDHGDPPCECRMPGSGSGSVSAGNGQHTSGGGQQS